VSGSHVSEPNEIAPPARHRFGTDNGHAWVDPLRTPQSLPCAVVVDGGIAVAMPEPDVPATWALTVFDPGLASAAADRTLQAKGIGVISRTFRFDLPIVTDPNALTQFASGLRMMVRQLAVVGLSPTMLRRRRWCSVDPRTPLPSLGGTSTLAWRSPIPLW
jgi:hypothetical protein